MATLTDRNVSYEERLEQLTAVRVRRKLQLEQVASLIETVKKAKSALDKRIQDVRQRSSDLNSLVLDDPDSYKRGRKKLTIAINKTLLAFDELIAEMDELLKIKSE